MSKTRRTADAHAELLRKYLALLERSRETDREYAETLADIRLLRQRLQEQYASHG